MICRYRLVTQFLSGNSIRAAFSHPVRCAQDTVSEVFILFFNYQVGVVEPRALLSLQDQYHLYEICRVI